MLDISLQARIRTEQLRPAHSQSSDRLLNDQWPVKLSNRLAADLKSVGAKLIFGQKVSAEQLKQKTGSVTLTDGRVLEGPYDVSLREALV